MQLSDPTYLWAFLGLLIPLAIHLLSRQAGKVVRVGSIRHLLETNTRKFSSLRFNEYGLFLLRSVMVTLFVLLLSGLSISGKRSVPKWVLLETSPNRVGELRQSLDSLQQAGYELRYWASGFPLIDAMTDYPEETPDYTRLLLDLKQTGAEAIIYASNRMSAFRGKQIPIPERVRWLQLPGRKRQTILQANRLGGDSVMVLRGTTGPERTSFVHSLKTLPAGQTEMEEGSTGSSPVKVKPLPPLRVLILGEKAGEHQVRLLEAAIHSLAAFTDRKIKLEKSARSPERFRNYEVVISTFPDVEPDSTEAALIRLVPAIPGPLLSQTGPKQWVLRGDLDRQSALRENLLIELGNVLFRDTALDRKIHDWELRTMDGHTFFEGEMAIGQSGELQKEPMDKWLILALILFFIIERILAFYRRA